MATATATTRRSGGAGLLLVVGGLVAVVTLLNAATATLDIEVATHATEKHGYEAVLARNATTEWIGQHGMPPKCKDGRYRIIADAGEYGWAITVLEEVAFQAGRYREITSFVTRDQGYIKTVIEDCGNGPWFGHVYGFGN